jgi:hypothetical protein
MPFKCWHTTHIHVQYCKCALNVHLHHCILCDFGISGGRLRMAMSRSRMLPANPAPRSLMHLLLSPLRCPFFNRSCLCRLPSITIQCLRKGYRFKRKPPEERPKSQSLHNKDVWRRPRCFLNLDLSCCRYCISSRAVSRIQP